MEVCQLRIARLSVVHADDSGKPSAGVLSSHVLLENVLASGRVARRVVHKYAYSAIHMCLGCGGLGDPYWVDMYEKSPTYLLCVQCRNPPLKPVGEACGDDGGASAAPQLASAALSFVR